MRSRMARAAGAVLLGLAAAAAARGGPGFDVPGSRTSLRAGTITSVRWTSSAGTDAREMELVLSLDGGRTFTVRVTGELEPDASAVDWRVPSLPTANARLALRIGSGSRESERIVLISEEFEIRADLDEPREPVLQVETEKRTREALTIPDAALPYRSSVGTEPSLSASIETPPLATSTRVRSPGPAPTQERHAVAQEDSASRAGSFPASSRSRAPLPLRL